MSTMNSCTFSILDHPAVIFLNERLTSSEETARLHTAHVFDFDQTLFRSPLPNPKLWDTSFVGQMVSWNNCGPGWWHNSATLDLGPEAESSKWNGWWNDDLGLNFDLIATKPTTAVQINTNASKNKTQNSDTCYVKIHTFSFKHDFLYNILFEYPSIQHMQVWDDRIGQIAKFHEAGKRWLEKKLLQTFKVIEVNISHRYMDPKRELDLVMAMIEIHNRQVGIEANGGPFLVSGAAPMPWTRPELQNLRLWDPYETYTPQKRVRMELGPVAQYTGILFSEGVQAFLKAIVNGEQVDGSGIKRPLALQGRDISKWEIPNDMHIILCLGAGQPDFLETIGGLGANVFVELVAVGELEGKIWALKVQEADETIVGEDLMIVAPNGDIHTSFESLSSSCSGDSGGTVGSTFDPNRRRGRVISRRKGTPYITLAYNRFQGIWSSAASKITRWESIEKTESSKRIILVGTIGETRLLGLKNQKHGHLAVVPRAEVSIANILKEHASEKDIPIQGPDLGQMIKSIQKEMDRLLTANRTANIEAITALAHATFKEYFK
ncbi:hypothetical protein BGX27_009868 [Mortierella sp. AM989]|nr:hypothetical protein BGX27_009868 [Mortierella sp. AM989]